MSAYHLWDVLKPDSMRSDGALDSAYFRDTFDLRSRCTTALDRRNPRLHLLAGTSNASNDACEVARSQGVLHNMHFTYLEMGHVMHDDSHPQEA